MSSCKLLEHHVRSSRTYLVRINLPVHKRCKHQTYSVAEVFPAVPELSVTDFSKAVVLVIIPPDGGRVREISEEITKLHVLLRIIIV